MSTNFGNMDQPFKIRCYDERFVLVFELQESGINRAKHTAGRMRKRGYKRVLIRKTKNVRHGQAYEWRFKNTTSEWIVSKFKEEHPVLFQEAV